MDFYGKKVNGKKWLPPAIAEQARRHWDGIKDGSTVVYSVTKPKIGKTWEQIKLIWGLMMREACEALSERGYDTSFIYNIPVPTGNEIKPGLLCDYFYNVCPIYNSDGQRITLSKSSIKEASLFFDECRSWMASQWGIVISEPDPNWKQKGK